MPPPQNDVREVSNSPSYPLFRESQDSRSQIVESQRNPVSLSQFGHARYTDELDEYTGRHLGLDWSLNVCCQFCCFPCRVLAERVVL